MLNDLMKLQLILIVGFAASCFLTVVGASTCDSTHGITGTVWQSQSTAYVSECAKSTVTILYLNITLFGVNTATGYPDAVTSFTPATNGGCYATVTPTPSGSSTYLKWDTTSNNNCINISSTASTTVSCQYYVYISNFSTTNYLDYESAYVPTTGKAQYSLIISLYRNTSSGCNWIVQASLTLSVADCNESPYFGTMASSYSISEYTAYHYSGSICGINATDPDSASGGYGTVALSVANVTRPNQGNATVDTTPFYIYGANFFATNPHTSTLMYDVTLCSNVTKCKAIFNASADGGYWSLLGITITATDGGGLSATKYITVNVTQAYRLTLVTPNATVTLSEAVTSSDCIYTLSSVYSTSNPYANITYTLQTISQSGHNSMWYLTSGTICYLGNSSTNVGTCCNRTFASTYSPYVIPVLIYDQNASSTSNPTFSLTVSITSAGDPPILNTPSSLNVLENVTDFSFTVNATESRPASNLTRSIYFYVSYCSSNYNGLIFNASSQSTTLNGGSAVIKAFGAGTPYFYAATIPTVYVNVSVTDWLYTIQNTVTINVQSILSTSSSSTSTTTTTTTTTGTGTTTTNTASTSSTSSTTTNTGSTTSSSTTTTVSTTTTSSGDLSPTDIGAIVGSIGGALLIAGGAWGIAKYMQGQAAKSGLTKAMKNPAQAYTSY